MERYLFSFLFLSFGAVRFHVPSSLLLLLLRRGSLFFLFFRCDAKGGEEEETIGRRRRTRGPIRRTLYFPRLPSLSSPAPNSLGSRGWGNQNLLFFFSSPCVRVLFSRKKDRGKREKGVEVKRNDGGGSFFPLVVWFLGLEQWHGSLPPRPFPPAGAKGNEEKEQNFHLFPLYPSFPGSSVLIPEKNFVLFSSSLFLLFLCTIFSGPSSDFYAQGGRREFEKMGFPPFLPSSQYEICGGTFYFLQRGQQ